MCDENISEAEDYIRICRGICDEHGVPAELKHYAATNAFLFDAEDDVFLSLVSILIVEPNGNFGAIPATIRKGGYDGLIIYLSHSTAFEHMIQGYDAGAFNYVLKGTDTQNLSRFKKIFEKSLEAAKQLVRQYVALSAAGEYKQIAVKDIFYFETVADHVINVEYKGGSFKFPSDMKEMDERLCERGFFRVHQSFIVSMDAIHRISYTELMLNDGRSVPIGRKYYSPLKSALERWKL